MNTFKVLCVYDMTLVLLKLNGILSLESLEVTQNSFVHIIMSSLRLQTARCLCNVSKQNRASAPFIQRHAEHAGFIFKSTFAS